MSKITSFMEKLAWELNYNKPMDATETRAMITKCLEIVDRTPEFEDKANLTSVCLDNIVRLSTDGFLKKWAEIAPCNRSEKMRWASNVAMLRTLGGSCSGNLPLAAVAICAMDLLAGVNSTKEEESGIGERYLSIMMQLAAGNVAERQLVNSSMGLSEHSMPAARVAGYRAAFSLLRGPLSIATDQALLQVAQNILKSSRGDGEAAAAGYFLGEFSKASSDLTAKVLSETASSLKESSTLSGRLAAMDSTISALQGSPMEPLQSTLVKVARKALDATEDPLGRGEIAATYLQSLGKVSTDPLVKKLGAAIGDVLSIHNNEVLSKGAVAAFDAIASGAPLDEKTYNSLPEMFQVPDDATGDAALAENALKAMKAFDTISGSDPAGMRRGKLAVAKRFLDTIIRKSDDPARKSMAKAVRNLLSTGYPLAVGSNDRVFVKDFDREAVVVCEEALATLSRGSGETPEAIYAGTARRIMDRITPLDSSGPAAAFATRPFIEEIGRLTGDDTVRALAWIGRSISQKGMFLYKSEEIVYRVMLDAMAGAQGGNSASRLVDLALKCTAEWDRAGSSKDTVAYPFNAPSWYNDRDSSAQVLDDRKKGAVVRGTLEIEKAFVGKILEETTDPVKKSIASTLQKLLANEFKTGYVDRDKYPRHALSRAACVVLPYLADEVTGTPEMLLAGIAKSLLESYDSNVNYGLEVATPFITEMRNVTSNETIRNLAEAALRPSAGSFCYHQTSLWARYHALLNALGEQRLDDPDRALVYTALDAIKLLKEQHIEGSYTSECIREIALSFLSQLQQSTSRDEVRNLIDSLGDLSRFTEDNCKELEYTLVMINDFFDLEDMQKTVAGAESGGTIGINEDYIDINGLKLHVRKQKVAGTSP